MTPEEWWELWLAARDPDQLLTIFRQNLHWYGSQLEAVVRRMRLFSCAVARQVWDLLPGEARSAVQTAERFAEGRASISDLEASAIRAPQHSTSISAAHLALSAAQQVCYPMQFSAEALRSEIVSRSWCSPETLAAHFAARAVAYHQTGISPQNHKTHLPISWNIAWQAARAIQADYLRDIIPPPHYPLSRPPEWLTTTVLALARQMDETTDFSALPILGDALEDAGCQDMVVLNHCRRARHHHVRCNWLVELVLEGL